MDIIFVLVGFSLYFSGAALFSIDYYKKSPALALASFAVPPLAWGLYRKDWEKSQNSAYAQLVGVGLIAAGFALVHLFAPLKESIESVGEKIKYEPAIYGAYVKSDESIRDGIKSEKRSKNLNGRIHGQAFEYDKAEFDQNGVLRISQGSDFYAELEISVFFKGAPKLGKDTWRKIVRPDDLDAPTIYLSWFENDGLVPQSQKFEGGYSMDLSLKFEEYNSYIAKVSLTLPDHEKSYCVGDFLVHSSRLRFNRDGLDRYYDSPETIEYIAAENIKNTYGRYVKDVIGFSGTDISYRSGNALAETKIFMEMQDETRKSLQLQFYKGDSGWFPDVKGLKDKLKGSEGLITAIPLNLRVPLNTRVKKSSLRKSDTFSAEENVNVNAPEEQLVSSPGLSADRAQKVVKQLAAKPVSVKSAPSQPQKSSDAQVRPTPIEPSEAAASTVNKTVSKKLPSELTVDLASEVEKIESLLIPLINKKIRVTTNTGKVKTGHYIRIQRKQVVVEIELGGGEIEYLTAFDKLKTIEVVDDSQVLPQKVNFFRSEKVR